MEWVELESCCGAGAEMGASSGVGGECRDDGWRDDVGAAGSL